MQWHPWACLGVTSTRSHAGGEAWDTLRKPGAQPASDVARERRKQRASSHPFQRAERVLRSLRAEKNDVIEHTYIMFM